MEAAEAKELIEEAVEAEEKDRAAEASAERAMRNRVALMIGVFAVALAIVHMAAAGAARESLLAAVRASDTFNWMQAKTVREAVYTTAAGNPGATADDRAQWASEARRLRSDTNGGHSIAQLTQEGRKLEADGARARAASEGYELGETALQVAIVLLSIAIVARSKAIVWGAGAFAAIGIGIAVATSMGMNVPGL